MTDVLEINALKDLRSFHLAWTALHARTPGASFFQTLEWLETYWRHFGEGKRLRVLIARSGGKPIGIVPMCEVTKPTPVGPLRVLTYPLDGWGVWFGPIGPWPAAVMVAAMRHLAATPRTWDVLQPSWTTHAVRDNGRTLRAMRMAGLAGRPRPQAATSVVECRRFADWNDFLAKRPVEARAELVAQELRLEQLGPFEHRVHSPAPHREGDGDPCWDTYNECLGLDDAVWLTDSPAELAFYRPRVPEFFADAHAQAARLGMVETHVLRVDGRAAASLYAYRNAGEVAAIRAGVAADAPPGALDALASRVVRACFDRGDTRVDLSVGLEPFQRRLRTTVVTSTRITHYSSRSWRPRAAGAAQWALGALPASAASGRL